MSSLNCHSNGTCNSHHQRPHHHHHQRGRKNATFARESKNVFTLSLLTLVTATLFIPVINCGLISRQKNEENCIPQIVAIKRTRIVPVAVPIKSMSTTTTISLFNTSAIDEQKDGKMNHKSPPKYQDDREEENFIHDDDEGEDDEYEEEELPYDSAQNEPKYLSVANKRNDHFKHPKDQLTASDKRQNNVRLRRQATLEPTKSKPQVKQVKVTSTSTFPVTTSGDRKKIRGVISQSLTAILSQTRGQMNHSPFINPFNSPIPLETPIDSFLHSTSTNWLDRLRRLAPLRLMRRRKYKPKDLDDWTSDEIAGHELQDVAEKKPKMPPTPGKSYSDQLESREMKQVILSLPESERHLFEEHEF